jgi:hypothetical protein
MNAGGLVSFVTAWLDREAKGKDWQKKIAARQQGDLFQWAEARGEVGTKRDKPPQPKANPRRHQNRGRAPE